LHNFWCALDCGIAVQPDNVAAQTESSIVYGLGLALMERITIKNGVVEQSNFYDYLIPRMSDVPPMHIEVISTDNPPTGARRGRRYSVGSCISAGIRPYLCRSKERIRPPHRARRAFSTRPVVRRSLGRRRPPTRLTARSTA
jgi:hypothetical protein